MKIKKVNWDLPIKIESDVIVVGGGPAGISAAIASARNGMDTVLIEQYGCVGGMSTIGLVGPFMTCFDTQGKKQIVKGIFKELVEKMVDMGGAINPSEVEAGTDYASFINPCHHNVTPFDSEAMKYVAEEMLIEAGVKIKLHTHLVGVLMQNKTIKELVFCDKSGLGLAFAHTYIDTTGDGDLAYFAKNPFDKGRKKDGKLQPASMFMRIGNVNDNKVREWKKEHPKEYLFESIIIKARKDGNFDIPKKLVGLYRTPREGEWRVNTSRILDIDGTDPDSLTRAEIEGRRQAKDLMKFFNEYCPGLENAYLIETASQVGIRETRRIKGKYTLTKEDFQQGRNFEDAIAHYGFFLDIHNPDGNGQESPEWICIKAGNHFEIPYRCLVPSDVDNLLVAGRCISTDHQANGAVREMPACFATGQAAGSAAVLTVRKNTNPDNINVDELRLMLHKDGCVL